MKPRHLPMRAFTLGSSRSGSNASVTTSAPKRNKRKRSRAYHNKEG
jgi:hypothetical protein